MRPDRTRRLPLPRRGGRSAGAVAEPPVPRRHEHVDQALVDCALYRGGERRAGKLPLDQAVVEVQAEEEGFVWIGLHDASPEVIEEVGRRFSLPPLAVEDAVHAHQRAKLERYEDLLFLVLKTARYVDAQELIDIGEITVFAAPRFVIAVRHGDATPLAELRRDLEAHPELLKLGPSGVLYAIADRVVDDYALVIDGIEDDIDEVETEVFSDTRINPARRIYELKREIMEFRRAVAPLIEPMQNLADEGRELPIEPRVREYFRDVQDHTVRTAERISTFDDLLTGVLQANIAQISMRDNRDMRRISAWVAIAAVPTMIFGLYGMNFEHMPELKWRLGYPAVLLATALLCLLVYRRFKRAGWL